MDKAPTFLLRLGLDGSPASLWVLTIGLALALLVGALTVASLIKLLQTRNQTQNQLKQLLQDLRLSRDELNLTVEAAGDGHWNWDMRHSTPHLQGELYGEFDLGDLNSTVNSARWSALIHPDDLTKTQAELSTYLRAPIGTFIVRFRLRDKEGHWRWIVSRGKAIQLEPNGRVARMIGVHYDETARREAELTAREENAKFSGIFITLPDAAGSSRISDGRYIEVNPAFERVLGYSRAEVVGKTSMELNIWANQGERDKLIDTYAKYGRVDRLEIMARTKSGQLMPGQMSASVASIGGEDCFVFVFRDLTAEKKIEAELNFSQSALDAAGRMGRMGAWVIYYDGTQSDYWSPVCREMVGVSPTEPVPPDFTERFVRPEHRQTLRDLERRSRKQLEGWDIELAIQRPDGESLWVRIVGEPVVENGQLVCTQGLMQDVDANHRAVDMLRQSEERFSNIFKFLPEAMAIIDAGSGHYLDVNPAWEAMTGLALADVLGKTTSKVGLVSRAISRERREVWAVDGVYNDEEIEITTQQGEKRTSLISVRAMTLNGVNCWISMHRDITERRLQQERLEQMAHFDALTGLPNRILLADRMRQAMAHAERTGELLGVVYLDLDGFKPVNDRLGHSAGDELLKKIAERLPHAMRGADSVARLGGDEFVLLLASLHNTQDCVLAMQRAMAAICEIHVIAGESVSVTASMGATLYPLDHSDADTLLRHADQAMYIAKQGGRNRFHFFDAGQEQANRTRMARLSELREALQGNQFVLHLQPRVDMRAGKVLGAEALVRWQHPEKGLLSPAHFLPEIEASELNIAFGEWVIDNALALLQRWVDQSITLVLSINITARHLQMPAFSIHLAHKMAVFPQVPASQLEIEVTESGSLSDLDAAVNVIEQLHTLGIQVSLDDFGTGYSSLTYLRRLPVDTLKIDQSFVRDMLTDPDDRAIVKGVIGLAQSFGLGVVAEGVENNEQGDMLLNMGCDMAQGYGIARPMPEKDLPPWVEQWQRSQGR